ncbi:MAG: hypothetical protein GY864_00010 [Desulfobacterales bacterium]|nr:hypothetical protein [Desulfobacterales bacterium]
MYLIFGILIGIAVISLYTKSKSIGKKIHWYVWGLYASGAASILLAVDTLLNSYAEHEIQAAWMGLGMFGTIGIILIIAGGRLYSRDK